MCGIAGVLFPGGDPAFDLRPVLAAMTGALARRGPDGEGLWFGATQSGPPGSDAHVPGATEAGPPLIGLGHRRLSIIDLAGGGQPMTDRTGRACVVFNGEIYNYQELRTELEALGFAFRTRSDTEALLNAYLAWGEAAVNRFEGMFAFAIWDSTKRTLFCGRDRFGKKPFYYYAKDGLFAFASELFALERVPGFAREVETSAIARFLAYEYVPTPDSIYRGVKKLKPGSTLTVSDKGINERPLWTFPVPDSAFSLSEAAACERLRELFEQAVRRRLVADVPLGVFLSGGIDSSITACVAAKLKPGIKTFSVAFAEKSFDESPHARLVARHIGSDHHEFTLSAAECAGLLPETAGRFDEPMSDPSIIPTSMLARMTRQVVTVALGGDGPDELFAGYEHYPGFKAALLWRRIPEIIRKKILAPIADRLPQSDGYVNPRFVAQRFLAGAEAPDWMRAQRWLGSFSPEALNRLFVGDVAGRVHPDFVYASSRKLWDEFPTPDPLAKLFYLFARQFMLDYILVKVDRCTMMHGLEARAPFLDRDFAEFALSLPVSMRLKGFQRKYLLKKAFRDVLPRDIVKRPKRGFLIPASEWLKGPLLPLCRELMSEEALKRWGIFDHRTLAAMLDEHVSGRRDRRKELWTMLVLLLWLSERKPSLV